LASPGGHGAMLCAVFDQVFSSEQCAKDAAGDTQLFLKGFVHAEA